MPTPTKRPLRTNLITALLLAAVSTGAAGCFLWTSRGEGDQLRTDVTAHNTRIASIEQGNEADRRALQESNEAARQKLAELERVLERATQVVTRNSADIGEEVRHLREEIAAIRGELAETRNQNELLTKQLAEARRESTERIDRFARRAGIDMPVDASEIPADRAAHFQAGERAFQGADYSRARALFREYVTRYPQDENADNALYMLGTSYLTENRPATALGELRKIITDYPQSDVADRALFDMADAFFRLHACTDARSSLDALIRLHPQSSLARRAREKMREIQRAPRDQCTS